MSETSCTVYIRNNRTGEVRSGPETWDDEDENEDFIWSEGAFACDCTRAMLFAHYGKEEDPLRSCGMTDFTVWIETGGKRIYADDDAPPPNSP